MRFKIDENLPVEVAELLRRLGHDATTILEQHLGGSADPKVASVCQQERRILVTLDWISRTYEFIHRKSFLV